MNKTEQIKNERISTTQKKRIFLESLERNLGVITPAMKDAGINSRATIKTWRETDKIFKKRMEECECVCGNFVENQLLKRIKDEDTTAIIFYCKTKLKNRGYIERSEITGADGQKLVERDLTMEEAKEYFRKLNESL